MAKQIFNLTFAERELEVELGTMANLSAQSVLVRYGDSVVLTTVNYSEANNNNDFFPLTIVFQEKLYSVGKIPGGFLKREGFPGEHATLCARLIDRSLRPLFPKGFYHEVQIVNNIFALDENSDIRFASSFASSLVLALSGLPFEGPSATVIISKLDGKLVVNPTQEQLNKSQMELVVGGTNDAINMVEAGCTDIEESEMITAIKIAHTNIKKVIKFQKEIVAAVKPKAVHFNLILSPQTLVDFLDRYQDEVKNASKINDKKARGFKIKNIYTQAKEDLKSETLYQDLIAEFGEERVDKFIHHGLEEILKADMRQNILDSNKRIDGRKVNEIRPLTSMIDILPVVHGSAMFNRGETQVLSILTLGTLKEHQIIDDLGSETYKRFMHHYNFPPFSVGEVGRMGKPSRREIGHGALGEKALLQVLPSEKDFPYTIRIVSEVLASNGSTSQAAICASSLALMAGGVPIRTQIAGIAMGLIKTEKQHAVLTDIQGLEDHLGDMDFKVAGTNKGICALQMDIKIKGLDFLILEEALNEAKIARMAVLKNMNAVLDKPRSTLAANAPKILQKSIPVDKIREVIGTQGKVINKIIAECDNVKIDIEEDGTILIYHNDQAIIDKTWAMIDSIVNPKPIVIGDVFKAKVVKVMNFGAFVNLKENTDGLIHISEFSKLLNKRIETLEKEIKLNDIYDVRVKKIEDNGKLSLEIIADKK